MLEYPVNTAPFHYFWKAKHISMISPEIIRSYFEELHIVINTDHDGDVVIVQGADSDFGHDVCIYVRVINNRLSYMAAAPGYAPEGDLYELANRNNCRRILPTAVVRGDTVYMECSFLLDEEVSKAYIVENCIKMVLHGIWQAFVQFEYPEE